MSLHAVPSDPEAPRPVDLARFLEALADTGHHADTIVEGVAAGAVLNGTPFLFSLDSSGRFLSIRAIWDTELDPSVAGDHLFAATDEWNRGMYFPTTYWITGDEGTVQVCADTVVDTSAGLSSEQLAAYVEAGISTGLSAMEFLHAAVSHTLGATDEA